MRKGSFLLVLLAIAAAEIQHHKTPAVPVTAPQASATASAEPVPQQAPSILVAEPVENPVKQVLDRQLSHEERRHQLHILLQKGSTTELATIAGQALPQVAANQAPHSLALLQLKFERGLRITALENLDQRAARDGQARNAVFHLSQTQTDPTLLALTEISRHGIEQNQPGKLSRWLDAALRDADASP